MNVDLCEHEVRALIIFWGRELLNTCLPLNETDTKLESLVDREPGLIENMEGRIARIRALQKILNLSAYSMPDDDGMSC